MSAASHQAPPSWSHSPGLQGLQVGSLNRARGSLNRARAPPRALCLETPGRSRLLLPVGNSGDEGQVRRWLGGGKELTADLPPHPEMTAPLNVTLKRLGSQASHPTEME